MSPHRPPPRPPGAPPVRTVDATRIAGGTVLPGGFSYSVVDVRPSVESGERRLAARLRVRLRSGKIVRLDGQFLCECLVHNRSSSGGRLRLPSSLALPSAVYFYDDQADELSEAHLVWRRDRDIGIRLRACAGTPMQIAIAGRMRRKFYALRR